MARIIAITGRVAVGKTTIARQLAARLDWQLLGIDRERSIGGDWSSLIAKVHRLTSPTIVESVIFPRDYQRALSTHETSLLHLTCDESVRRERLELRPDSRPSKPVPVPVWPRRRVVDTTHGVRIPPLAAWALGDVPVLSGR
jgi:broad-specificity NMP kinase